LIAAADALSSDRQRAVITCGELSVSAIGELLASYRLTAIVVATDQSIPGSYWGAPEAGLVGDRLFYRSDTPVHSLLHELAHFVCMDPARRDGLDTDAGGDDDEECAVCYLQILLADRLPGFGSVHCLADMDTWGYSFRQGSARAWLDGDGRDARGWLVRHGLVTAAGSPTWQLRE
jgi:hypothetical protein